jgi:hypothetical protein
MACKRRPGSDMGSTGSLARRAVWTAGRPARAKQAPQSHSGRVHSVQCQLPRQPQRQGRKLLHAAGQSCQSHICTSFSGYNMRAQGPAL